MTVRVPLIALIHLFAITAQPICPPDPTVSNVPYIIEDPTNETRNIGEATFCVCKFNNTPEFPVWRLNETSYLITDLPSSFEVNETGLIFNASAPLHNTRFECYFIICTQLEGCCEIQSSPGYLTLRGQQQGPRKIVNCKPMIVELLVSDVQDSETAVLEWIPNPDCDRLRSSYLYITKVKTCQTPQSSPSLLCSVSSSTATKAVINNNCLNAPLREIRPVLFRVQTDPDELSPDNSSFLYTNELNITDTVLAEVNETTIIPRPGGKCSTGYKLCIRGLYNACFTILNGLPPEHRLCTSENVSHLCIDISDRSLNGSVYTVLCPQVSVPDCNISSAVDVLTYNFRLIINGSDSQSDNKLCGRNNNNGECIAIITISSVAGLALIIIVIAVLKKWYNRRNRAAYENPDSGSPLTEK